MDVGKSIRIALAKTNRSQKWLAEELGVTRQIIWVAKNNKSATGQRIEAYAAAFGMKASEFIALGED